MYQDNVKSQKRVLLINHDGDGDFSSEMNSKGFWHLCFILRVTGFLDPVNLISFGTEHNISTTGPLSILRRSDEAATIIVLLSKSLSTFSPDDGDIQFPNRYPVIMFVVTELKVAYSYFLRDYCNNFSRLYRDLLTDMAKIITVFFPLKYVYKHCSQITQFLIYTSHSKGHRFTFI